MLQLSSSKCHYVCPVGQACLPATAAWRCHWRFHLWCKLANLALYSQRHLVKLDAICAYQAAGCRDLKSLWLALKSPACSNAFSLAISATEQLFDKRPRLCPTVLNVHVAVSLRLPACTSTVPVIARLSHQICEKGAVNKNALPQVTIVGLANRQGG
jgi:hypothetical protein